MDGEKSFAIICYELYYSIEYQIYKWVNLGVYVLGQLGHGCKFH
jgi:hypothetical protein